MGKDLLAFVREQIRSVWALELLLLLRRPPPRGWSAEELVRELRASAALVEDNLARFEAAGLVVREDGLNRYAPASAVLAKVCDELEAAYREKPVRVINAIAAPADKLQALADAFKLKGSE